MIETEGYFLKMNCKVLDSAQLKKLDKQEKVLAQEIHSTGKGKEVLVIINYLPRNQMSLRADSQLSLRHCIALCRLSRHKNKNIHSHLFYLISLNTRHDM